MTKISSQKFMHYMAKKEWEKLSTVELEGVDVNVYPPKISFEEWLEKEGLLEDV